MPEMGIQPSAVGPLHSPVHCACSAADAGLGGSARFGRPSSCSCTLELTHGPAGPIVLLHVVGEIDMLTLPALEQSLTAAIDQRPCDLVIDLAAVVFCCVRGFVLIATTAATAQANGVGYAVSGLPPHLARIASLVWSGHPGVPYRSAAAAVTAIRIEHTYRSS